MGENILLFPGVTAPTHQTERRKRGLHPVIGAPDTDRRQLRVVAVYLGTPTAIATRATHEHRRACSPGSRAITDRAFGLFVTPRAYLTARAKPMVIYTWTT